MIGVGYRKEMLDWDAQAIAAAFFEVAPENWIRKDRSPLYRLIESGRPVYLHGVSLNLAGTAPLDLAFLREVRALIEDIGAPVYSDHLSATGYDGHLYDLFPVPFTLQEARRVADRVRAVQDVLGRQIAVENITWYTNTGDLPEAEFVAEVLRLADCRLLLDLNNIAVNDKNHRTGTPQDFIAQLDLQRVAYIHVAGHEFDPRFGLYMDTHSQPVEAPVQRLARELNQQTGIPVLLEWDNDVPDLDTLNKELQCLQSSIAI